MKYPYDTKKNGGESTWSMPLSLHNEVRMVYELRFWPLAWWLERLRLRFYIDICRPQGWRMSDTYGYRERGKKKTASFLLVLVEILYSWVCKNYRKYWWVDYSWALSTKIIFWAEFLYDLGDKTFISYDICNLEFSWTGELVILGQSHQNPSTVWWLSPKMRRFQGVSAWTAPKCLTLTQRVPFFFFHSCTHVRTRELATIMPPPLHLGGIKVFVKREYALQ